MDGYTTHVNPIGPSIIRFAPSLKATETLKYGDFRYTMHSPLDRLYLNYHFEANNNNLEANGEKNNKNTKKNNNKKNVVLLNHGKNNGEFVVESELDSSVRRADLIQVSYEEYYLLLQRNLKLKTSLSGGMSQDWVQMSRIRVLRDRFEVLDDEFGENGASVRQQTPLLLRPGDLMAIMPLGADGPPLSSETNAKNNENHENHENDAKNNENNGENGENHDEELPYYVNFIQIVRCERSVGTCRTTRIDARTLQWKDMVVVPQEGNVSEQQEQQDGWITLQGLVPPISPVNSIFNGGSGAGVGGSGIGGGDLGDEDNENSLTVLDMFPQSRFNSTDMKRGRFFLVYNATQVMSFDRVTGQLINSSSYSTRPNQLPSPYAKTRVYTHLHSSSFVIATHCLQHFAFNAHTGQITFLNETCSKYYDPIEKGEGFMDETIGAMTPDFSSIYFTIAPDPENDECYVGRYNFGSMVFNESKTPCANMLSRDYYLALGGYQSIACTSENSYLAIHSTSTMVDLSYDPVYNAMATKRNYATRELVLHYITKPFAEYMRDYFKSLIVLSNYYWFRQDSNRLILLAHSSIMSTSRVLFFNLFFNNQYEISRIMFGDELSIHPVNYTNGYRVPESLSAPFIFESRQDKAYILFDASPTVRNEQKGIASLYSYDFEMGGWGRESLFTNVGDFNALDTLFLFVISSKQETINAITVYIDTESVILSTRVDTVTHRANTTRLTHHNPNALIFSIGLMLKKHLCFTDKMERLAVFSAFAPLQPFQFIVRINMVTGEILNVIETDIVASFDIGIIKTDKMFYIMRYRQFPPNIPDKNLLDKSIKIITLPANFDETKIEGVEIPHDNSVNIILTNAFGPFEQMFFVTAESTNGKSLVIQIMIEGEKLVPKKTFFIGDRTGPINNVVYHEAKNVVLFFAGGVGDSFNEAPMIHVIQLVYRKFQCGGIIAFTIVIPSIILIVILLCFLSTLTFMYKYRKVKGLYVQMEEKWIHDNTPEHSTKKWMIDYNDLKIERVLGKGVSGKVYEGRWGQSKVAIKLMLDVASDSQLIEEAHTLIQLRHMNILLFLGICIHEDKRYLITELLDGGSLESKLTTKFNLDFASKVSILRDVSEGMSYLHGKKPPIVHRDLKPQNIFLDQYLRPKIGDFGLSKCGETVAGLAGTVQYCAPEILAGQFDYTTSCDIYSFAILMYHVLTEQVPYGTGVMWNGLPQQRIVSGERPSLEFLVESNWSEEVELSDFILQDDATDDCTNPFMKTVIDYPKLRKWCKRYGYTNVAAVKRYVLLMMECWQGNPVDRPEFIDIHTELQEIARMLD